MADGGNAPKPGEEAQPAGPPAWPSGLARVVGAFFSLLFLVCAFRAVESARAHSWVAFSILLSFALICGWASVPMVRGRMPGSASWQLLRAFAGMPPEDDAEPDEGDPEDGETSDKRNSLLAGAGIALGAGLPEEGKPVPPLVLRSPWWRVRLWAWFIWAGALTYAAVRTGMQHHWWELVAALTAAVGSWLGLLISWGGNVPPDFSP